MRSPSDFDSLVALAASIASEMATNTEGTWKPMCFPYQGNEMKVLQVETSKLQFTTAILLGLFIVPMSLLTVMSALRRGLRVGPFALGVVMLVGYGVVLWLVRRARARSVKCFSDEGLLRFDGRSFDWKDLSRVVKQINTRGYKRFHWRTEIHFKSGESAWLLPRSISNFQEVSEYVDGLPCEHTEVIVG